jgi:hypothetical protein
MSLSATTITAAIAELSVNGLTIKDVDDIPQTINARDCPVLFPMPGSWLGTGSGFPEGDTTFGTATTRYWQAHRVYTYVFIHSPVGTGRGINEQYEDATNFMDSIPEALIELDVATVDIENITHKPLGIVTDPAGTKFIGTNFDITFRERINE